MQTKFVHICESKFCSASIDCRKRQTKLGKHEAAAKNKYLIFKMVNKFNFNEEKEIYLLNQWIASKKNYIELGTQNWISNTI